MKIRINMTLVTLIAVVTLAACNGNATGDDISVRDAWARPTAAQPKATPTGEMENGAAMTSTNSMGSGPVSAAYMVIENETSAADKLIGVSCNVADMAEIHETKQTSDGMTSMQPVQGGLQIPAQGSVTLQPGGYHIMLMGLHQNLVVGQAFSMTLKFQSGKQMTINVPVKQM